MVPTPQSGGTSTSPDAAATLADADEFEIIAAIVARFPQQQPPHVTVGPGDDAAVVRCAGDQVVVSTDVLVDGRHFRRDWASAVDVGHRAAAQSLSDLNAMGTTATAVTVGLAAPGHLEVDWVLGLADGLAAECAAVGAAVVGGDLTRSDLLTISVTALGELDGPAVLRSGARPGDVVALTGRQGWAAAGLAVLSRGFRSPRAVVEAYRRPLVPYAAGNAARRAGATALIDVSDGLLSEAQHIASASGVAIDIRSAALPVEAPLEAVGAAVGVDPLTFVLTGGDDHSLLATFPEEAAVPDDWTVIGTVGEVSAVGEDGAVGEVGTVGAAAGARRGVTVDGSPYAGEPGFRHF